MSPTCSCRYEYKEDGNAVRVDCVGCIYGASIEDFDSCFGRVIDIISEVKKVSTVIMVQTREYEYDWSQTRMLVEVARILDEIVRGRKLISIGNAGPAGCRHVPERLAKLQHVVLGLWRSDPIGAYVELVREIRKTKGDARSADAEFSACSRHYLERALIPILDMFERAALVQLVRNRVSGYHVGDRSLYREIFHPTIRPNFMLTRYMEIAPPDSRPVDKYKVGDTEVEILRVPDKSNYIYHVSPPEFKLTEEKYTLLDAARRYMASHEPRTTEFAEPQRSREVFLNIDRDLIRELSDQMRLALSSGEVEELAKILTRYTAGLGILEVLLADERIQDIYVNSPVGRAPIFIYHADYQECETNLIPTREDADSWATRFRIASGRPLDEANPVLDTDITVPGGSARVCSITRTLSPDGLGFAFRRHRDKPWTLPLFIKNRMMDPLAAGLLSFLVDGSASLLVAGGRGSGKTSLLGALMVEVMPSLRICTVEDTLELPTDQLRNLGYNIERMKSRSVITRVETEMPADEALRTALRLGDSVLIIGEVRSVEAKALYEAMRIGALSNLVAGTIHGESAYGVYDRVVNDLGVPPTSFKATDIVLISKMLRSADGLHKFRRLTEVAEVRKHWKSDPAEERGFVNLMEYSAKTDQLKPTDTLVHGESEVINRIAGMTKDWEGRWDAVWENIQVRAKIKQMMVDAAAKLNRPDLLEAPWVMKSNAQFHLLGEKIRNDLGALDSQRLYSEWLEWFNKALKV